MARALGRLMHPIQVFERIGILPFRPASHEGYVTVRVAEPAVFGARRPASIHPPDAWTPSVADDFVMSHVAIVDSGFATRPGDVFDRRGHRLPRASHKYRPNPKRGLVSRTRRFGARVPRVEGEVAALTAHGQDWYFHWLFDVLGRIAMLERAGIRPDRFYLQHRKPFQRESLALLGLEATRIIDCDALPILSAERWIVPCHEIASGRRFPEWLGPWLRARLMEPVLDGAGAGDERIFVSRSRARHRRVSNEDEIADALSERGFTHVELETLPLAEQIRLFHGARAVVSPHGGGLANLVFCSPGTKVVELFPDATIDLYFRLSCAAGLDYSYLKSERAGAKLRRQDYAIDPGALKRTLDLAGL